MNYYLTGNHFDALIVFRFGYITLAAGFNMFVNSIILQGEPIVGTFRHVLPISVVESVCVELVRVYLKLVLFVSMRVN